MALVHLLPASQRFAERKLAGKVGLDRTAITKIEVGRRHVNSLELVRLAEMLDRLLQSFVSAPPASIVSRRAAVAGGRDDQASDFAIEDIARDVRVLVDVRALSPNPAKGSLRAIVSGEEGWGPEEAAAEARSLIGVDGKSPIHLYQVSVQEWITVVDDSSIAFLELFSEYHTRLVRQL